MRIKALPADAPFWADVEAAQAKAEQDQKVRDVDDVLAMIRGGH